MEVQRTLQHVVINRLNNYKKICIIYGPRQAGKTTISRQIIKKLNLKTIEINGDDPAMQDFFHNFTTYKINSLLKDNQLLFIDEAQQIPNIDKVLKLIADNLPQLKVLITGSSAFYLSNKITEALTGRKFVFQLFPFAFSEVYSLFNIAILPEIAKSMLVYGAYPEVFLENNLKIKQEIIEEITQAYLFKDILSLGEVKYSKKLISLAKLLAFQISKPVSINELSNELKINHQTVERYIDILTKLFVVYELPVFSTNLRNTIKKQSKYYFYDLGIRNALISNFNDLSNRNDIGQLWENFIITERLKNFRFRNIAKNFYYWRTYDGAEIDLIEQENNNLQAFEIKYKKFKKYPPKSWKQIFPNVNFTTINFSNFLDYIIE